MGTLAKRLLACKQPVIDLESEDIGEVITSSLIDASEVDNQVSGALNDIQMLGDTVDMLEACSSSASGLISQGVGPEIVTRILEPTIINALASVDSEIALAESIEFESDDASADEGASWFKRVKDWVIKIYETIRNTIENVIEWLTGMFNKVFDATTRLHNRAKRLLTVISAAEEWNEATFEGKGIWAVDLKDPTARSLDTALRSQEGILLKIKKAAELDVTLSNYYTEEIIKLFDGVSRGDMNPDFAKKLNESLEGAARKRRDNITEATSYFKKDQAHDITPVGTIVEYKDSGILSVTPHYSIPSKSNGYNSGEVKGLTKSEAIASLKLIVSITSTALTFESLYTKASANSKKLELKLKGSIEVFKKSEGAKAKKGSIGDSYKQDVEYSFKYGFQKIKDDLIYVRNVWNLFLKGPSARSAANAYDFVETSFKKGRKTAEA